MHQPSRTPGLIGLAAMELERETTLGRTVELRTYGDLSPFFRDQVVAMGRVLYTA
jgi:hypothetical protein